jgi:hypothetical protein
MIKRKIDADPTRVCRSDDRVVGSPVRTGYAAGEVASKRGRVRDSGPGANEFHAMNTLTSSTPRRLSRSNVGPGLCSNSDAEK